MTTAPNTTEQDAVRNAVRDRYGAIVREEAESCCGPGCCSGGHVSPAAVGAATLGYTADDIADLPEGADLGLGCGNPTAIAALKPGETVLDLGSGAGIDCFIAAKRVGPSGKAIGIDMTPDMITQSRAHAAKAGFTNVDFRLGEIEAMPVADGTVDVILSNCVINLSPDKPRVFAESFRALKRGGRLAISDIVATDEIPDKIRKELELLTGCISGAARVEELKAMLKDAGFNNIVVDVDEKSRDFIKDWSPESGAHYYVTSAKITATKP